MEVVAGIALKLYETKLKALKQESAVLTQSTNACKHKVLRDKNRNP